MISLHSVLFYISKANVIIMRFKFIPNIYKLGANLIVNVIEFE